MIEDTTSSRIDDSNQQASGSGLAAPTLTNQTEGLARTNGQIDSVHRPHDTAGSTHKAPADFEVLLQTCDLH
jgi:hypothetical protein